MAGYSEEAVAVALQRLDVELKVTLGQFTSRLRNQGASVAAVMSRRQISQACHVLHMDPPRNIIAVEWVFFEKAHRQFKAMAKEYHPDMRGSEVTRPQFDAVMAAWRVIEQFRDSLYPGGLSKQEEEGI
jgi:hypothetical protein